MNNQLCRASTGSNCLQATGYVGLAMVVLAGTAALAAEKGRTATTKNNQRLWDAGSGKELLVLEGHTTGYSAVFSPDGKRIISGDSDKPYRLLRGAVPLQWS